MMIALFGLIGCSCGNGIDTDSASVNFVTPKGENLKVFCVFHGSIAFEYDGKVIHVDPVTSMGEKKIDYSAFGKADAIFITHGHHDHLCPEAVDYLTGSGTILYANAESVTAIGKGIVLENGDTGELFEGVKYTAVPAYNTTEGREVFHPKGNGNGYVFEFDDFRVYVAGDTEPIDAMKNLGKIDLAFLAVNQPYTMTVGQCVEVANDIRPNTLIPYHYSDTDLSNLPSILEESGIEVKLFESLR